MRVAIIKNNRVANIICCSNDYKLKENELVAYSWTHIKEKLKKDGTLIQMQAPSSYHIYDYVNDKWIINENKTSTIRKNKIQELNELYSLNKDISVILRWNYQDKEMIADTFSFKNIDSIHVVTNTDEFDELLMWDEDLNLYQVSISTAPITKLIKEFQKKRRDFLRLKKRLEAKIIKGNCEQILECNLAEQLDKITFIIDLNDNKWKTKLIKKDIVE